MKFPILLFDGVCNLCNTSVQFIIERDEQEVFQFASLQSDTGQALLTKHGQQTTNFDTIVLVTNDGFYTKSNAALRVAKELKGLQWLWTFRFVPRFIRDGVYSLISRNRYRWFGKQDSCMMPRPEWKARFLD